MQEWAARAREHRLEMLGPSERIPDDSFSKSAHRDVRLRSEVVMAGIMCCLLQTGICSGLKGLDVRPPCCTHQNPC